MFGELAMLTLLAVAPKVIEEGSAPASPTVIVRLDERADVPPFVLLQAQEGVSEIFAAAGVRVRVEDVRKDPSKECGTEALCIEAEIRDVPEGYRGTPLGIARPFAHEGVQVEIFYPHVELVTSKHPLFAGRILAHILVHEITHVLTRVSEHSREGMLKAKWTESDFRAMGMENLPFERRTLLFMKATLIDWGRRFEGLRLIEKFRAAF